MQTTAGKFASELIKLIQEEYEKKRDSVIGGSARDYAEYQRKIGYISGLHAVLEMMEDAQTNAEKR
jgi:hypothetical protein